MEFYIELKKLKRTHRRMIDRCYNKNSTGYKNYGGRGIDVCDEWKEQKAFIKWALANGWQMELQIDRIDNNKGYSPENCRFTTSKINNQNKTTSKRWHIEGKIFESSPDAAKYFGVHPIIIARWCDGQKVGIYFYPPKPNCWSENLYQDNP